MALRIGLSTERAELALDVAALAAEIGAEVVPLSGGTDPVRSAAVEVILIDGGSASRDGIDVSSPGSRWGPETGPTFVVVHRPGEAELARADAERRGATHVVELPTGAAWLAARLRPAERSRLLGVVGAVGGAGATTLAIACAAAAAPDCLLVDADARSTGVDLPLGIPDGIGGRWECLPDTDEPLVAESVRAALPHVAGITVITGPLPAPTGGRFAAALGVGRAAFARTVVDCGRAAGAVPLEADDSALVACPATLGGLVAVRRVLEELPTRHVALALRPTGWLPEADFVAALGGLPFVSVPRLHRAGELSDCGDLLGGRTGRTLRRLGGQVWGAVA